MDDEKRTVIGKRSKMTVGVVLGLGGVLTFSASDHTILATIVGRVSAIEVDRRDRISEQYRVNTKILKWLSAIGQRLRVPEPPAE